MEGRGVPLKAVCLTLLLAVPLALPMPLAGDSSDEDYAGGQLVESGQETNVQTVLQPRGPKPAAAAPVQGITVGEFQLIVNYLTDFGYLAEENEDFVIPNKTFITEDEFPEEVLSGLEWFQRQNGLKVTGKVDQETAEALKLPRCGKHEQRMAFNIGAKWKKLTLTYKILNRTSRLTENIVRAELKKALSVWENVSPISFVEVGANSSADIDIFFVSGIHADGGKNAFDGSGRVLGHAFFPPAKSSKKDIDGDLHLDNDENWTSASKRGINLFQVAAHEVGHSLGLDHSTIPGALMAPTYKGYNPVFQLHQDDIDAIQSVYGKPSSKLPNTPAPAIIPVASGTKKKEAETNSTITQTGHNVESHDAKGGAKTPAVDLCGGPPIDTFISTKNGSIYVLKGKHFWELNQMSKNLGPKKGYPQLITSKWKLPASIDASIRMQNPVGEQDGKLFFFKGNQYWKFDQDQMEAGYPKKIAEGFPGVPADLDAAFTQPAIIAKSGKIIRGERIFFIKGDQYILYDPAIGNSTQPQSLSEHWVGVQVPITAALSYKNEIYLIGPKKFQKVLMLNFIQDTVFAQIQQPKNLQQLITCAPAKI
ncbi:matrix metalloproteinase-18-like [Ambystoma mexicanum]|uniref:matrix metalloproteinase-18-like n=1 Tax=Ambystoma mexicanum TaxID=8296 RepID=UPI0037E73716